MSKEPASNEQLSQLNRNQRLKKALYWVAGIHVAIILVAAVGMPFKKKQPFDLTQAVAVDLVAPTGEVSAAANKSKFKGEFKPHAKPVETKKPPAAQPEKPPSPVKSDAAKKEETPVPPKPAEKPKPPEPKKEEPKPVKKEAPAIKKAPEKKPPAEKPKPKPKPQPKPTPQKSRDDGAGSAAEQKEFNSVLKNLLGDVDAKVDAGNPVDAPYDPNTKAPGTAPVTSDVLALSEMDALKYQLAQCWNVPTGAMDAENLIVDVRIEVGPDRIVRVAEIVDQGRYNSDSFFRAAADSARRAVFNPRCTPLNLPPDKYDTWKNILIRFNPRDMFGG